MRRNVYGMEFGDFYANKYFGIKFSLEPPSFMSRYVCGINFGEFYANKYFYIDFSFGPPTLIYVCQISTFELKRSRDGP